MKHTNHKKKCSQYKCAKYDYIIVGGGTSGCVLASRLTEDPNIRVLLIEAGQDSETLPPESQFYLTYPVTWPRVYFDATHDWQIWTEPLQLITPKSINITTPFRRFVETRAKLLGGCSGHNAFGWSWGADYDYNNWNLSEWTYDKILPYLKKCENCTSLPYPTPNRGQDGPIYIKDAIVKKTVQYEWLEFAEDVLGLVRPNSDINAAPFDAQGWTWNNMAITKDTNTRLSSYDAYIRPVLSSRSNLTIKQRATVSKICLCKNKDKTIATGIKYYQNDKFHKVKAKKEVIICGGVVNSPKLLQLSGIGSIDLLKKYNIKTRINNPSVGKNIKDHMFIGTFWSVDMIPGPTTPPSENPFYPFEAAQNFLELEGFVKSNPLQPYPNLEMIPFMVPTLATTEVALSEGLFFSGQFLPSSETRWYIGIEIIYSYPKSVGSLQINSNSFLDPPSIVAPYFNDENGEDIQVFIDAMRQAQEYMTQFKEWLNAKPDRSMTILDPVFPSPDIMANDSLLAQVIASLAAPSTHIIGGCKMGNINDNDVVVDQQFKVLGTERLRVVDGSVIPDNSRTRPQATIYAMAEKAAELIKNTNK